MTGEAASREELVNALEEAATDSLELYRSALNGEMVDGVIHDAGAQALLGRWEANLKRWKSVLSRCGRDFVETVRLWWHFRPKMLF